MENILGSSSNRHKALYAAIGAISLVVWFTVFYNFMIATSTPNNAFMIILLGLAFYAFFYTWLFALAKIVYPRLAFQVSLGLAILYMQLDILFPPYFITQSGQILTTGATFTFGASDVLVGEILVAIGITGPIIWWLVYLVFPILILFVATPIFLSSHRIAKALIGA